MASRIEKSIVIDESPEHVWRIATTEFDQVGEWASSLEFSRANPDIAPPAGMDVGGRVCTAAGFGDVRETITNFDPDRSRLTYKVDGLPGFVTQMDNTWSVASTGGDRTRFTIGVDMDTNTVPGALMGPIMKRKLSGTIDVFLTEFKLWVEKGEISEAKRKLNAKVARKRRAA